MRAIADSGTLSMRGRKHWVRCAFANTSIVDDDVALTIEDPHAAAATAGPQPDFAGIAFDRHCRLFHPVAAERRVEVMLWARQTEASVHADETHRFDIAGASVVHANALACDAADYLYIADRGDAASPPSVWVVDIWQREVAKRVKLATEPLDLCCTGDATYVLLAAPAAGTSAWLALRRCHPPRRFDWPAAVADAARIDVLADPRKGARAFVLVRAGSADARIVCLDDPAINYKTAHCTDFVILPNERGFGWPFMVAYRPGEDFELVKLLDGEFTSSVPYRAPNYDGCGIARAPDGRVAYWTKRGLRHAARARPRYKLEGSVYGFALDSNREQTEWGRVCLEACIPPGTSVTLRCLTRDDLDYGDHLARTKPQNDAELTAIARAEATPLPSQAAVVASFDTAQPMFRDEHAPPLSPPPEDTFMSYDAPVLAPAGRFLWLLFDLRGASSKTPRLRSVRVEFPGHDLLQHLPKTLWREDSARYFLRAYLAPIAATLGEWGEASASRHRLLDPRIARADALEWLGSLVGLALDPCWPERARRDMLRSAVRLFRVRGTPAGLCEMITILTGAKVLIVELFKLRSGGVVGNPEARQSRSVLGAGFRVGGNVGATAPAALAGAAAPEDYAHRFTVMIVAQLSDEQLRCVRRLIETHKPAHTMFDVCSVSAGTRVGMGLHVGIAAVIGHNSGFDYATLGDSVLGKGYVLGRPGLELGSASSDAGDCVEVAT